MESIKKTALLDLHKEHHGRIIEFSGWKMPLQYEGGVLAEHLWTRKSASLFDVGHMTICDLDISEVEQLETITPTAIKSLPVGKMRYGVLTNKEGGIIDDYMVTRISPDLFRLIANASRFKQVQKYFNDFNIQAKYRTDLSLIALQGPLAAEVLASFGLDIDTLTFLKSKSFQLFGTSVEISRSGYTGEDGFEITVTNDAAMEFANNLLNNQSVNLAALGARDSLRLEAGLCLYGNEIDETITPVEADLVWSISKDKLANHTFIGADIISDQILSGVSKQRVGIVSNGRKPIRPPAEIYLAEGEKIGHVTSGTFSPTMNAPIAMGYLPPLHTKIGTELVAKVRGKDVSCMVTKLPFVETNYYRGN